MSALLFFLGCIPARLLLVYIAYFLLNIEKKDKKDLYSFYSFLLITMTIGVGFWTIYGMGWRKTGMEVGGGKIWWNSLRPVHGTNYLLFTLLAYMGWKHAWIFLLADVVIGIVAEWVHLSSLTGNTDSNDSSPL